MPFEIPLSTDVNKGITFMPTYAMRCPIMHNFNSQKILAYRSRMPVIKMPSPTDSKQQIKFKFDCSQLLDEVDEEAKKMGDRIATHEFAYESLVVALNGLQSSGTLTVGDPWAKERMEAFELWSGTVKRFSEKSVSEAFDWAAELGLVLEDDEDDEWSNYGDFISEDDNEGEGDEQNGEDDDDEEEDVSKADPDAHPSQSPASC